MYKENQVLDTLDVITRSTALKSSITSIERYKGGQQKVSSLLFYYISSRLDRDDLNSIGIELKTLSSEYPTVILNVPNLVKYIAIPTVGIIARSIEYIGADKLVDFRNYKIYLDSLDGIEALADRKNVCISTLIVKYTREQYTLAELNSTILQIIRALGNNQLQHLALVVSAECIELGILKNFDNIFKVKITFIVSFAEHTDSVVRLGVNGYLSVNGSYLCALTKSLNQYLSYCNQYFYQFQDFSYIFPVDIACEKPQYNVIYYNDLEVVATTMVGIENYFNMIDIIQ